MIFLQHCIYDQAIQNKLSVYLFKHSIISKKKVFAYEPNIKNSNMYSFYYWKKLKLKNRFTFVYDFYSKIYIDHVQLINIYKLFVHCNDLNFLFTEKILSVKICISFKY